MRRLMGEPRAEQRRQSALLDMLSDRFDAAIYDELIAASGAMVDHFELTGEVPVDPQHIDRLREIYLAMADASIGTFASRVMQAALRKSAGYHIEGKTFLLSGPDSVFEVKDFASTLRDWARAYVEGEAIRRRIVEVTDTTRNLIIRAVARGFEDGLGQRGVAEYVRSLVPSLSRARSALIARTETHGAAQHGAQQAAAETGLKLRREWISAEDHRTRLSHALANEQVVGMDEPFIVGGVELAMPGDPSGPADQVINCRCVVGYIVDE